MKQMSRFQIQMKGLEEAWGDTLSPITDAADDEARTFTSTVAHKAPVARKSWQWQCPTQVPTAVNERGRQAHVQVAAGEEPDR